MARRAYQFMIVVMALFLSGLAQAHAVCVEDVTAPDSDDQPLSVRIWFSGSSCDDIGAAGSLAPLIIISHGTGGSSTGHSDTAEALAEAGFVAASVTHTGDNYRDDSYVGQGRHLIGRPRHISRVIDYMLTDWQGRETIDPARIGMFGHSAGGFTALVIAGGKPDMSLGAGRCQERPQAWECRYLAEHGLKLEDRPAAPPSAWSHDPRVKAVVVAAPCCGWAFEADGLSMVNVPVQLWEASDDPIVDDSPAFVRRLLAESIDDHVVEGAGHLSFLAPCNLPMNAYVTVASWFGMMNICRDQGDFDRRAFHEEFNAAVIDFFSTRMTAQSP
jgi:predicted dienelactone hydrolase